MNITIEYIKSILKDVTDIEIQTVLDHLDRLTLRLENLGFFTTEDNFIYYTPIIKESRIGAINNIPQILPCETNEELERYLPAFMKFVEKYEPYHKVILPEALYQLVKGDDEYYYANTPTDSIECHFPNIVYPVANRAHNYFVILNPNFLKIEKYENSSYITHKVKTPEKVELVKRAVTELKNLAGI